MAQVIVLIDEAQDNSELQSALLYRLFFDGAKPSLRQRFGDSNQAIYSVAEQGGASTDQFPSTVTIDLPRSFRFGQSTAEVVKGLGVVPQSISGSGPSRVRISADSKTPTLFLFDDDSVRDVLPRYGAYLISQFSESQLRAGTYVAVAGVHETDRREPIPCSIRDFAPLYDSSCSKRERSPSAFLQYLARARAESGESSDTFRFVNAVGAALLRAVGITGEGRRRPHKRVLELLNENRAEYYVLLRMVIDNRGLFSKEEWEERVRPVVVSVSEQIAGCSPPELARFLTWPGPIISEAAPRVTVAQQADNSFNYPEVQPKVRVRLGSIHSVKGETHTATLVLESYYHGHHLGTLKPWILGTRSGGLKQRGAKYESNRLLSRLRLHYVAMTRPSHLLCLGMRKDAFSDEELLILESKGWHIENCCA